MNLLSSDFRTRDSKLKKGGGEIRMWWLNLFISLLILVVYPVCLDGFESKFHAQAFQRAFKKQQRLPQQPPKSLSSTALHVLPPLILPVMIPPLTALLPWLVPTAVLLVPPAVNLTAFAIDKVLERQMIDNLDIAPEEQELVASQYTLEGIRDLDMKMDRSSQIAERGRDNDYEIEMIDRPVIKRIGTNLGRNASWEVESLEDIGKPVLAARFVTWTLTKLINARTQFVSGLYVNVLSKSNKHVFRGQVSTIEIKFDRIAFGPLLVTGGGKILMEGVNLQMRRFLFRNLQALRKPYQIYADFLLTQSDVVNSKMIKNLLQTLVDLIFKLGVVTTFFQSIAQIPNVNEGIKAKVKRVSIRERRLFVNGEAQLSSGSLPFEISTGVGLRAGGQVIFLKDIEVVINPDNPLRAAIVLPYSSAIDVDVGDDCRFESFVIANKHVWMRARSSISPVNPFQVSPVMSKALFRYDMSALFSSVLRIRGGFMRFSFGFFNQIFNFLFGWLPFYNSNDNNRNNNDDNDDNMGRGTERVA